MDVSSSSRRDDRGSLMRCACASSGSLRFHPSWTMCPSAGRGLILRYPEPAWRRGSMSTARPVGPSSEIGAVSTYTTHAATEVAGGPLVETGRRVVPGAPKLAVFAAVVVLVVVSMEASFPSHAAWLVGLGVLSIAVGLARLTPGTARRAGIETERATRDAAGLALENARLEAELQVTSDELR